MIAIRANSKFAKISDLKGARVATLDPYMAITQLGRQQLRQGGVDPDREVRFDYISTSFNAAQSSLLDEVDAIFLPSVLPGLLPAEMSARLRVLAESPPVPGIVIYARKGASLPRPEILTASLIAFVDDSEPGRRFVKAAMLDGFRAASANDFKMNDAFLPEFRKLLGR